MAASEDLLSFVFVGGAAGAGRGLRSGGAVFFQIKFSLVVGIHSPDA